MQNAILVSELFLEYTIYFPKCYRFFIKEDMIPNDRYLLVLEDTVRYDHTTEMIYIDDLADLSNCYVRLQPKQKEVEYLITFFQYLIKRYKMSEDTVEQEYKKLEDSD